MNTIKAGRYRVEVPGVDSALYRFAKRQIERLDRLSGLASRYHELYSRTNHLRCKCYDYSTERHYKAAEDRLRGREAGYWAKMSWIWDEGERIEKGLRAYVSSNLPTADHWDYRHHELTAQHWEAQGEPLLARVHRAIPQRVAV